MPACVYVHVCILCFRLPTCVVACVHLCMVFAYCVSTGSACSIALWLQGRPPECRWLPTRRETQERVGDRTLSSCWMTVSHMFGDTLCRHVHPSTNVSKFNTFSSSTFRKGNQQSPAFFIQFYQICHSCKNN